jgi:hypothetical protein
MLFAFLLGVGINTLIEVARFFQMVSLLRLGFNP